MSEFQQKKNRSQNRSVVSHIKPDCTQFRIAHSEIPPLAQQQALGNQAVQHLLQSGIIQAKLKINEPGDKYEQEAEQIAEDMMRMSDQQVKRQVEEEEISQTKDLSNHTSDVPSELESRINALRKGGQPLPGSVRAFFEPRFGYDFSRIRVHVDTEADRLNRTLNARAFTIGQNIFFRSGKYNPGSSSGRELLAHELTHVVQQNSDNIQRKLTISQPSDQYEQEADQVAEAVIQGEQGAASKKKDKAPLKGPKGILQLTKIASNTLTGTVQLRDEGQPREGGRFVAQSVYELERRRADGAPHEKKMREITETRRAIDEVDVATKATRVGTASVGLGIGVIAALAATGIGTVAAVIVGAALLFGMGEVSAELDELKSSLEAKERAWLDEKDRQEEAVA